MIESNNKIVDNNNIVDNRNNNKIIDDKVNQYNSWDTEENNNNQVDHQKLRLERLSSYQQSQDKKRENLLEQNEESIENDKK